MKEETDALEAQGTWDPIPAKVPPGAKAIKCRFVYKNKFDEQGRHTRYKSRLVCMGYSTVYGVHYFETFAPVVNASSLRLLMLYALENELELEICDVDNAFVQADLSEDTVIYMEAPPGMDLPKGYALYLRKALYGINTSPHHFNNHLDERLRAYIATLFPARRIPVSTTSLETLWL
jgi:hypothetical protein